jgi:hypothetical protein
LYQGHSPAASEDLVEKKQQKRCPACDQVPLILLSFDNGNIDHARIGCRCRSLLLLPEFEEEPQIAQPTPIRARRSRPRIR